MSLILVLLLLTSLTEGISMTTVDSTERRLFAEKGTEEEDSTFQKQFPFLDPMHEASQQKELQARKKKKNIDKQPEKPKEELGSEWHVYFVFLIIATLLGMKMLSVQEQKVKNNNRKDIGQRPLTDLDDTAEGPFPNQQ